MSDIDSKVVKQIAYLSRLALNEQELQENTDNLKRIVDFVEQINHACVDKLEPLAHPMDMKLILRDDVVTESDQRADFIKLAPNEAGLYLVPTVIE